MLTANRKPRGRSPRIRMTLERTSQRIATLKPTAVNAIMTEVGALDESSGKPVSLMRGEPDLPTPTHIVAAATEALQNGRTGYPHNQGEPNLRQAIAHSLERDHGLHYDWEDEILITSGATFGIYCALSATIDPGDEVLIPEPSYDAYHGVVELLGGTVIPLPSNCTNGRYSFDRQALAATTGPHTRAILLNTPWNPTGTVFRSTELESLATFAAEAGLVVLSDEIYEKLLYDDHQHHSLAAISPDARQRTILINSLSKSYAMTGWRIGYCAGPADLLRGMALALQQSSRGPATFVQDAATVALNGPQDCLTQMRAEYARRRREVDQALNDLPGIRVYSPEAGFFSMVDVHAISSDSNQVRRALLRDQGVVVMHGAAYGPAAEGMLRISFASGGDNLSEGLRRLRAGLQAQIS